MFRIGDYVAHYKEGVCEAVSYTHLWIKKKRQGMNWMKRWNVGYI